MNLLRIFAVFLLLHVPGCDTTTQSSRNLIVLPKLTLGGDDFVDIGSVSPSGKPIELDFVILNDGNAPLEVSQVEPSCHCSRVSAVPEILMPGKHGVIRMVLDRTKLGQQSATATVYCNCLRNPIFKLKAAWEVRGEITASPSEISIDLQPGISKSVSVELEISERIGQENVSVQSVLDHEGSDIEHAAILENRICKLTLSAPPGASSNTTSGAIKIRSSTTDETLFVRWTVSVQARLSLTPRVVWFRSNSEMGSDVHSQILVRAINSVDLENIRILGVSDVTLDLPFQETKLPSNENLRIFDLTVPKDLAVNLNTIIVQTEDNAFAVEVPVRK